MKAETPSPTRFAEKSVKTDVSETAVKILSKSPIVMDNRWWEWMFSFLVYAGAFLLMWEYHRWRGRAYSLFTANKAVAITSSALFSFSLVLGPLHRLTGKFFRTLRLRRPLGVTAAVFMVLHMLFSLFLVEKFNLTYYMEHWLSLVFGVTALIGFLMMWATSYKWALNRLGDDRWKKLQTLGYVFLALVILHTIAPGKLPNWILWFKTFNPPAPPGTMIPSAIVGLTILLKIVDSAVGRKEVLD